jgi:type III restriction enzyme
MAAIRPDGQVLQKHIYDYLVSDSKGERKFAAELDTDDNVVLFAKLPKGFSIPTPVGNYNPDWAIVYNREKVRHLYFVAETKGSLSEMQLRGVERAKIEYAKKHFLALIESGEQCHVTYQKIASYQDLINVIQSK